MYMHLANYIIVIVYHYYTSHVCIQHCMVHEYTILIIYVAVSNRISLCVTTTVQGTPFTLQRKASSSHTKIYKESNTITYVAI